MSLHPFILFILILSIVPNLGFFSINAFLTLTFAVVVVFLLLFYIPKKSPTLHPLFVFVLLIYSCMYYGGLYQNPAAMAVGTFVFMGFLLWMFLYQYIAGRNTHTLSVIIITYVFLALLTTFTSAHPTVDTFTLFKEAPLTLLEGKNAYDMQFTQVYKNIPNNFPYMPFSLLLVLPSVLLFGDPRIAIVIANLVSAFILMKFFEKKFSVQNKNYMIAAFLFFPRSFFMLEHMYLDPIIFCFFLLFVYFYERKKDAYAFFALSLLFSFKVHIAPLMFPLLLNRNFLQRLRNNKNLFLFFLPFALVVYFFVKSPAHFLNTFIHLVPNTSVTYIGPAEINLSFTNFINKFVLRDQPMSYLLGVGIFAVLYLKILRLSASPYLKIAAVFIFFQYFTYMSFLNHYFFAALLWFFYILMEGEFTKT